MRAFVRVGLFVVASVLYLHYSGYGWAGAVLFFVAVSAVAVVGLFARFLRLRALKVARRNQEVIERAGRRAQELSAPWLELIYHPSRGLAARRPWLWPWARIDHVRVRYGPPPESDPVLRRTRRGLRRDRGHPKRRDLAGRFPLLLYYLLRNRHGQGVRK